MGRQKKNAGQIEKLEEMANKGKQLHLNSYIQLHDIFNWNAKKNEGQNLIEIQNRRSEPTKKKNA